MKALTSKEIQDAKPRLSSNGRLVKYQLIDSTRDRGVGRLIVNVFPSGTKEFSYKYNIGGKRHYISLGRYPALSLVNARKAIIPFINLLVGGLDPKTEIEKEKKTKELEDNLKSSQGSIKQLFHAYTNKMKMDKKRTYIAVLKSLEKEVYPVISENTKAKDVTREQMKLVIANLIERNAVTQSNRVRSYLMAAFNYALLHDNDPAVLIQNINFGIKNNPVMGIPKQKNGERIGNHYLSIDDTKYLLSTFIHTPKVGYQFDALLKLCFYTGGQRPYELCTSSWENLNWEEKTLLITEDYSKNKTSHLIPLTETALLILKGLESKSKGSKFIFSQENLLKHSLTTSLSRGVALYCEINPGFDKFIPRDIRRTCKTLMGEIGVSKDIRDRLQNHALNDVSSKHYDRYDYLLEKREALLLWERKLLS